jgi:hypothetical protein
MLLYQTKIPNARNADAGGIGLDADARLRTRLSTVKKFGTYFGLIN